MDKIIGVLRSSPCLQIGWRRAHDPPILGEALDAQRTIRQFAIPDGKILSLPYEVNITVRQVEIDGHFRVFGQERIQDRDDIAAAEIDWRAQPDRP